MGWTKPFVSDRFFESDDVALTRGWSAAASPTALVRLLDARPLFLRELFELVRDNILGVEVQQIPVPLCPVCVLTFVHVLG
jgi:hypothetical protein